MNISSKKFDALISEFPEERASLARLRVLLNSSVHQEMTLDHLILELSPRSIPTFARALERLAAGGLVERLYRVESRKSRGPIQDFQSYEEIPTTLFDWHSDTEIEVLPSDLRVIYVVS